MKGISKVPAHKNSRSLLLLFLPVSIAFPVSLWFVSISLPGGRRRVGWLRVWGRTCHGGRARPQGLPEPRSLRMRNRCGLGLEDEGRRAGPRKIPTEEEKVGSKAGRAWQGPCGVRSVQPPAPALTSSDSHSCCLLCSVLASPDTDVISASNQAQPVFTPHEPSLLWFWPQPLTCVGAVRFPLVSLTKKSEYSCTSSQYVHQKQNESTHPCEDGHEWPVVFWVF